MAELTIDRFKDRLIADGITSVNKNEKRSYRKKGGLAGFDICKSLNSYADFTECLEQRRENEHALIAARTKEDVYWEYRMATLQVEHVFERMKVAWAQFGLYSGPLSSRAVMQTAEIVGVADEQ